MCFRKSGVTYLFACCCSSAPIHSFILVTESDDTNPDDTVSVVQYSYNLSSPIPSDLVKGDGETSVLVENQREQQIHHRLPYV
jgi:hypothetical protein